MKKMLLRFARAMVQQALSQLTQQLNIVQDQAYKPMQMMVQQVTNGVWVGKGADQFVQEVTSLAMPNVDRIGQQIVRTQQNINFAIDTIDKADEQVRAKVNALGDLFGAIY
jgi:hypothetical protein